jgi:hypothetical protein
MGEARIKAGIWVSAALRMGMLENKPGVVVRKGDVDAGGVLVKLYGRTGCVVLSQFRDMEGNLAWMRATGPAPVDEQTADEYIAKQTRFDPDLWVLEFDAADYRPPFEGKVV